MLGAVGYRSWVQVSLECFRYVGNVYATVCVRQQDGLMNGKVCNTLDLVVILNATHGWLSGNGQVIRKNVF